MEISDSQKKKNKDPNDAIARVLEATVRKNDPEEVKQRKKELRKQKKRFLKEQQAISAQENKREAKRIEEERKMKEKQRNEREARIKEQMAQLEIDRKEHKKRMKKQQEIEKRRAIKQAQELEEQVKKQMAELAIENEKKKKIDEAASKAEERVKTHNQKIKEAAKIEEQIRKEREEKSRKLAEEGRKLANERVIEMKAKEVHLSEDDTNNLQTLFDHYISGNVFNRADWLNLTESLGLMDEILVKKEDLENAFILAKNNSKAGINFQEFCFALGAVAQITHPGEEGNNKDNTPSKCLERLIFEMMGGMDDITMDFDPNLDDSYLEGYEETEEEKTMRLAEEKAAKKARKEAKKKRDKEARLKAEEERRVEAEKQKEKMKKIEEARLKAANRVMKRKKEEFKVSDDDSDNLCIYYDHFKISPAGMSRGDLLNLMSTLEILDGIIIQKKDCEEIFDKMCTIKTRGLSFEEFAEAMSLLAIRRYHDQKLNQTEALVELVKDLVDGED